MGFIGGLYEPFKKYFVFIKLVSFLGVVNFLSQWPMFFLEILLLYISFLQSGPIQIILILTRQFYKSASFAKCVRLSIQ